VVCAGNPPTRPEGLWILKYWGAWLDPKHSNPARPGELRWFIRGADDEDVEVDGRGPHTVSWRDKPVLAKSRTFIPSSLADNPDLARSDYAAMLDSLPEHLRTAYADGNFRAEFKDDDDQLIPTAWVLSAIDRWKPDGHKDFTMTAIAVDNSGGGDATVVAARHRGWYAPLVSIKGEQTKDGNYMAGQVVGIRRHGAPVIVDAGGGFSGAMAERLKDNGIFVTPVNFAEGTKAVTRDAARLSFANKRAEMYWRFREALDPNQEGGSVIALPPDDELKADLCAVHWHNTPRGVLLEPKDAIRNRIGRSPDKGDAVVMCLEAGTAAVTRMIRRNGVMPRSMGAMPTVTLGYSNMKRGH
jgi:hypothetical protein